MAFSFDGVSLAANGWVVELDSNPWGALARNLSTLQLPGRDGSVSVASSLEANALTLTVFTPVSALTSLMALFSRNSGVLSDGTRQIAVDIVTVAPSRINATNARVAVVLSAPNVFWRAVDEITYTPVALDDGDVTVQVFSGISAPIRDAIIRVKGSVTGLRIDGGNGSWFSYSPNVGATSYLRFESATGRAFVTTTDTWTGGTEVTGSVLNGAGPYFLELVPTFTDPTIRVAEIRVTSSARSGTPAVEVRGRNAHLV